MIDVIPVNPRFCWEPLIGKDSAIFIRPAARDEYEIVHDVDILERYDWTEILIVDMRGQRVYICFSDEIPDWLAMKLFMRVMDNALRTFTISGITTVREGLHSNE